MNNFQRGFILGVVLSKNVFKVATLIVNRTLEYYYNNEDSKVRYRPDGISDITFVCKVKNEEKFLEIFPESKVQPYWDYCKEKKTIKIKMDSVFIEHLKTLTDVPQTFEQLFNSMDIHKEHFVTLDLDFFRNLGDCTFYIDYYIDSVKYVTFCNDSVEYTSNNLIVRDNPEFICASIKVGTSTFYMSKEYKYFQGHQGLTPNIVLDYTEHKLKSMDKLIILNKKGPKDYLPEQLI